jgi:3-amino-5-hydroxybenzoate synthase
MTTPSLALLGGPPVRDRPFPGWPHRTAATRSALLQVHDQGPWWQDSHSAGEALEAWLAAEFGRHAIAVSSGTAALEVALRALGIGAGDEVVMPAITFVSTASAVSAVGAVPVPADVDPVTLTLDPAQAEAAVTVRTRAIIPVHLAGHPADLPAMAVMARRHGLAIVEDSAQAVTASWDGIRVATSTDAAILSFQQAKLLPGGDGGALLMRDEPAARTAELLANNGRPRGDGGYHHQLMSTNARISVWAAALVLAATHGQEQLWQARHRHYGLLAAALAGRGHPGLLVGPHPSVTRHDYYAVLLRPAAALSERGIHAATLAQAMTAEGIPAKRLFPPWQATPAYSETPASRTATPQAEHAASTFIALPHHLLLDPEMPQHTATAVDKIASRADDLLRWQQEPAGPREATGAR